jgi:hypothetical protein
VQEQKTRNPRGGDMPTRVQCRLVLAVGAKFQMSYHSLQTKIDEDPEPTGVHVASGEMSGDCERRAETEEELRCKLRILNGKIGIDIKSCETSSLMHQDNCVLCSYFPQLVLIVSSAFEFSASRFF